ncbi:hypothetical protein AcV7_009200 [Taiwanofungus camphoratus]|nr:hypothetical protein AcV7_009200 [Antrodia cinnamomea]
MVDAVAATSVVPFSLTSMSLHTIQTVLFDVLHLFGIILLFLHASSVSLTNIASMHMLPSCISVEPLEVLFLISFAGMSYISEHQNNLTCCTSVLVLLLLVLLSQLRDKISDCSLDDHSEVRTSTRMTLSRFSFKASAPDLSAMFVGISASLLASK